MALGKQPDPGSAPRSGAVEDRPTVTILGLGQMGLVCAAMLCDPDRLNKSLALRPRVRLWGHSAEEAGAVAQTRKSERLPGLRLPDEVRVSVRDHDALHEADLIVSAVPVQYMRSVWERLRAHVPPGVGVISVAKGLENGTLLRPTQVITEVLRDDPDRPARPLAALSGPTIAPELARCLPATMVAASDDEAFRARVQQLFTTRWMRIYTSHDLIGVELAGAIKNVIAIAAGILDGLQAGNNAKSALLARGLAEIARLGSAMGASPETFFGVTGVGDLATSCFSPEGRNRSCGEALGKGTALEEYLRHSRSVVEGVATTRSVVDLASKYRVEMPIVQAVNAVLFEGLDPIDAIGQLMTREPKAERIG
ncbi:MAG: NAD(P)H-dependent glycerol-3-phosphate dehydrogenase [Phycisphaerales bacterium]|jgi:glycerol-3-phosphate dehydrogenase (NAD(P)+)|nr:NAD(P)-dependent glycerol-3-phosphate dehydrogenase [Phycisphaeraceae bacterium]